MVLAGVVVFFGVATAEKVDRLFYFVKDKCDKNMKHNDFWTDFRKKFSCNRNSSNVSDITVCTLQTEMKQKKALSHTKWNRYSLNFMASYSVKCVTLKSDIYSLRSDRLLNAIKTTHSNRKEPMFAGFSNALRILHGVRRERDRHNGGPWCDLYEDWAGQNEKVNDLL